MRTRSPIFLPLLFVALSLIALLLGGCSSPRFEEPAPTPGRMDLGNSTWVKQVLYAQYEQWKTVKYKSGGMSKDGVDCSGFVSLTYDRRLGIKLPRSTDEQAILGVSITQRELIAGDLVFFKTGRATRHVGIYLEDGKFLHASTEKGVMISRMDDAYWTKTYWKAVRLKA
ncbi:MAG TPA: NlpC/P60 family protein [Spongiibacteraceae bacterium]|nr:NlpC/P60 family protein [Spongiibacteraceae bacterium]